MIRPRTEVVEGILMVWICSTNFTASFIDGCVLRSSLTQFKARWIVRQAPFNGHSLSSLGSSNLIDLRSRRRVFNGSRSLSIQLVLSCVDDDHNKCTSMKEIISLLITFKPSKFSQLPLHPIESFLIFCDGISIWFLGEWCLSWYILM